MNNDDGCFVILFFGGFMFLVGTIVGHNIGESSVQQMAIKRNHAVYHPVTGQFTWKEDLKNEDKP